MNFDEDEIQAQLEENIQLALYREALEALKNVKQKDWAELVNVGVYRLEHPSFFTEADEELRKLWDDLE